MSDGQGLTQYHYEWWSEYILRNVKSLRTGIQPRELQRLIYRWAYFNKDYSLGQIKKDFADRPKLLEWILKTDKEDHKKVLKQTIKLYPLTAPGGPCSVVICLKFVARITVTNTNISGKHFIVFALLKYIKSPLHRSSHLRTDRDYVNSKAP